MLFPHAKTFRQHLGNALGALLVGLLFAYIGLNAATGCGQGGQCVQLSDFSGRDLPTQMADKAPRLARHAG